MKKLFIVLILTLSSYHANADWYLVTGTGTYMGERHIGFGYASQNGVHLTDLSYGQTPGIYGNDVDQLNVKYTFSPFDAQLGSARTNILGIGLLLTRWQSSGAFFTSPEPYPAENYYSPTQYRGALVLTHKWIYKNLQVYFDWALLDQLAIALFNNDKYVSKDSVWAGGFGLRWRI